MEDSEYFGGGSGNVSLKRCELPPLNHLCVVNQYYLKKKNDTVAKTGKS